MGKRNYSEPGLDATYRKFKFAAHEAAAGPKPVQPAVQPAEDVCWCSEDARLRGDKRRQSEKAEREIGRMEP